MCFTARLQQQHRGAALRQPRGQGAARAAGAHHDVVEVSGPAGAQKKRGKKRGKTGETGGKTQGKLMKHVGNTWQNIEKTWKKHGKDVENLLKNMKQNVETVGKHMENHEIGWTIHV